MLKEWEGEKAIEIRKKRRDMDREKGAIAPSLGRIVVVLRFFAFPPLYQNLAVLVINHLLDA